jgi:hypothetical protein
MLGGVAVYVYTHQDEIKQMLVKEINKNLLAPVTVQKMDISIFEEFPLISLQLKGVTGMALPPQQDMEIEEELFDMESLSLSFNIIDIYYGKYIIKKITIEGGEFNLVQYDKIQNNYIFWKTSKSQDTAKKTLSFRLSDIKAKNTFIRYRQPYRNLDVQILCKNIKASGELFSGGQKFNIKGNYKARLFETDSIVWVKEREGELDIYFAHDVKKGAVYLNNSSISMNTVAFKIEGNVFYNDKIHTLDLFLEGKKNNLENILSLLPLKYSKVLNDYKSVGSVDFSFRLNGDYSQTLQANIKFSYQNGTVTNSKTNIKAEDIFIDGEFTNGENRCLETSELICGKLSAKIEEGTVDGTLAVKNFAFPYVNFNGNIESELSTLAKFSGLSDKWDMRGKITAQLLYRGGTSEEEFKSAAVSGIIRGENIFVSKQNNTAYKFYADSIISNLDNNITAYIYNCFYNEDRASFVKISIENFFPFLFKKGELNAKINAENIYWNKVNATSVNTDLFYHNSILRLNNFYADVFNGNIKANAVISEYSGYLQAAVNANVENIDIAKCFAAFDNFNQQTLTDKNISGVLKSDFGTGFIYNYDSGIDVESILFDGTINIRNGNLKNLECLRSVARFTGENDLRNIHFSEMSNTLNIKDGVITIPLMQIKSDVSDFNFQGTHTFDNYADYRINLELSDMLSKNFKKKKNKDSEFGNIVENEKERIRLPLHVFGFISDLKVKYDFKQSRENFKEKAKEERSKTREILKQEFSRSSQQQEKQQWKEQEKGKFVFEKEDEIPKTQTKKQKKIANQFSIEEDD